MSFQELGHAAIELGDGIGQRRAAPFVSRRGELAFQLDARKPERFDLRRHLPNPGISRATFFPRPFQLFTTFLDPGIVIDQTFACITHGCLLAPVGEVCR